MSKPLVLLAMNAFNRERFIVEAIESVLAQDYKGWQLHITDDGSTDSTPSIIESYVRKDDRIQATYFRVNQGPAAALQESSSREATYLGWIDSDDVLHPKALSELLPVMTGDPKLDCVYSQYNTMTEQGTDTGLGYRCQIPYSPTRLLADFMVFHFRLMKWTAYKAIGLDVQFKAAIDYEFFLRFSEKYLVQHFPKSLYRYRQHYHSISGRSQAFQSECAELAIKNALKRRNLSIQPPLTTKDDQFFLKVL